MIYLLAFFSVFAFAGVAYNTFKVPPDWDNAAAGVVLSAFTGLSSMYLRGCEKREWEFYLWALEHQEELYSGEAEYNGFRLNLDTVAVKYEACFSFGFFTYPENAGLFFPDQQWCWPHSIVYTLLSLAFGWWCLPWGPVKTLKSIAWNLFGGRKASVGERLDDCVKEHGENLFDQEVIQAWWERRRAYHWVDTEAHK